MHSSESHLAVFTAFAVGTLRPLLERAGRGVAAGVGALLRLHNTTGVSTTREQKPALASGVLLPWQSSDSLCHNTSETKESPWRLCGWVALPS